MTDPRSLKQLIADKKFTYRQLAAEIGTTHDVIVRWCKPNSNLYLSYFLQLAKILDVSLDTLAQALGKDLEGIPTNINHGGTENRQPNNTIQPR